MKHADQLNTHEATDKAMETCKSRLLHIETAAVVNNNDAKEPMTIQALKHSMLALLLIFSCQALADPTDDFNRGVELFKSRNYEASLKYFLTVQEQGLDSIELHYNLGSVYYKLERYEEAKTHFNKFGEAEGMRDLADFNLGLIAMKQRDFEAARTYFEAVVKVSKDEKLNSLAQQQLSKLPEPVNPWNLYLSTNIGYDDNIASAPEDSISGDSDYFADIYLNLNRLLEGSRKQGWMLEGRLYQLGFVDSDEYDEDNITMGLKKSQLFKNWETSIQVSLTDKNFAGEDYQSILNVDLRARKPLSASERLYLRYQFDDIDSDDVVFDYQEGWRQRFRVEYRDYRKQQIRQFYYELELNERDDLVTADYSYEYSPLRHTLLAKYTLKLDDSWDLSGNIAYRLSDFPGSSSFNRNDNRLSLGFIADYQLDKGFKLSTQLQYAHNDSSVERYDYDRSLIKIGISKLF